MKNKLRIEILEKRKKINIIEISTKIISNLFLLDEYKKSKNIICYYPLKYEINTCSCFQDESKNWFLPRVNNLNLEICPYNNLYLSKGSFNITEPTNSEINNLELIDMVIIPSIASDRNGYRIGYGKGYYDRFLPKLQEKTIKVVLTCSEFLFDTIFPEKHDFKSNIIITDKEIFRI